MDEEFYIPGFTNELASSVQSQPTAQPVQTAADYSNLNLGNLDFGGWGGQNFVPDFSAQTAAYQPAASTTNYQSFPTPQPVTAVPYTDTSSAVSPLVISPEEQARMEAMFAQQRAQYAALSDPNYIANQQAKDDWLKQQYQQGNYYTEAYNPLDFATNSGGILNLFGPPSPQPAFDPSNPTANMQPVFYFDNGARGSVPDPVTGKMVERNAHPLTFEAGQTYKMLDAKGNVVGTASTPAEMQNLVKLSEQMPVYSMQLEGNQYGNTLPSGGWLPSKTNAGSLESMLLNMAALALPAVGGAVLGPALAGAGGLGIGVSAPVGVGLGTAAGTAASGALAGKSLKDILLQSALSGLTAGGLSALTTPGVPGAGVDPTAQYIKTLTGVDVPSSVFGGASFGGAGGGGGGGSFAGTDAGGNFINVLGSTGSKIPTSFLSGALNAAGTALGGANYGDQVWNRPAAQETEVKEPGSSEFNPDEGIVVKAGKYDIPFDPTSILNKFLSADYTGTPDYGGYQDLINKYLDMYDVQGPPEEIPEGSDEGWDVVAPKENVVLPPPASLPDLFPPLNSVDIPTDLVKEWPEVPAEDNEIVVKGYPPRAPDLLPVFFPPINSVNVPPADQFKPSDTTKSDLDKIIEKIKAATTLASLAGAGAAAAGSGKKSSFSAARGPLNPIFSAKLPKPNMRMAMPRALNFDAYRYGYGPEQSFFTNVPQGALNTSTAYTGYGTSPRYNATEQYAADFSALAEAIRKAREEEELKREEEALAAANALGLTGYAEGGEVTDDEYRLAQQLIAAEQNYGGEKQRAKRKPSFRSQHDYDDKLYSRYELEFPVGDEGALQLNAMGRGFSPDVLELAARLGNLRASHMLGGGSEYGYSTPVAGGNLDISAYAPRGLAPSGIRASYRKQFDEGGFAVGGPGDGRDDKIPAMLSDGEYVIDAETVAMLGNGSNKAGAEALDKLRVNVRKHKGRQLSKGKFSVNAKKPEQYLKGRK